MRFKKRPQLPGAGRTRAGHHHGSHTPTSPGAILLVKWPITPNKSAGQCIKGKFNFVNLNFKLCSLPRIAADNKPLSIKIMANAPVYFLTSG